VLVIGRDGLAAKLTDFQGWFGGDQVDIGNVVWSPDSHRLAFFVGRRSLSSEPFAYQLAVTDATNGDTVVYCSLTRSQDRPQWSPDSRYLAISDGVVIDTIGDNAYRVATAAEPLGWLSLSPQDG